MYAFHPLIARTPAELFATAWRQLDVVPDLELMDATAAYVEAPEVQRVLDDYEWLAPRAWVAGSAGR